MKGVVYIKLLFLENFNTIAVDDSFLNRLSDNRRRRYDLYLNSFEKKRFLVSEMLIMNCLKDSFSIEEPSIISQPYNKPLIKNGNKIDFNKSYCDSSVCIAISDKAKIGIDCERIQPKDDNIMRYFFTPHEINYVENSPNKNLAFTLIWTRKESFIKCISSGLNFKLFELDTAPTLKMQNGEKLFSANDAVNGHFINSYLIDELLISVCASIDDSFPEFQRR